MSIENYARKIGNFLFLHVQSSRFVRTCACHMPNVVGRDALDSYLQTSASSLAILSFSQKIVFDTE